MVIRGLEKNGQRELAGEIALEHLRIMTAGLPGNRHGLGKLRPRRGQARRRRRNATSSAGAASARSST